MDNWIKWQTIVMVVALIGGAIAAYVNVQATLATHTTKLDNIEKNQKVDHQTVADLRDSVNRLLGRLKLAEY